MALRIQPIKAWNEKKLTSHRKKQIMKLRLSLLLLLTTAAHVAIQIWS